jgi:hypothetical protein
MMSGWVGSTTILLMVWPLKPAPGGGIRVQVLP